MQKPTLKNPAPAVEPQVAFAVIKHISFSGHVKFRPERLTIKDGMVSYLPLHEAVSYEPLAYEYLASSVMQHYAQLTIDRAKP